MKLWNIVLALSVIFSCLFGCSSTKSEWGSGEIQGVGSYNSPPPNYKKERLAVLDFKDKTGGGDRAMAASDQMTTLWVKSRRFRVVERTRLKDLLKEQGMVATVRPDQLAKTGEVLGAKFLCYGSITDFEIKKTKTKSGGGILSGISVGPVRVPSVFKIDFKKDKLDFHIGVDVRIVNSTTGEVLFAESADVRRTETAEGMGLTIAGIGGRSDGSVDVGNKNQGRLLRMALDRVVKKLLPEIDRQFSGQ